MHREVIAFDHLVIMKNKEEGKASGVFLWKSIYICSSLFIPYIFFALQMPEIPQPSKLLRTGSRSK